MRVAVALASGVWLGINQVSHQPSKLLWRVELTRALASPFGKLPQQVFVCSTQDVRLRVPA